MWRLNDETSTRAGSKQGRSMMARRPQLYPRSCHILHPPPVVDLGRRIYRWRHLFDGSFTEQRLSYHSHLAALSLSQLTANYPSSAPLILRPPSGHQHITCSFQGPFAHPRYVSRFSFLGCITACFGFLVSVILVFLG
jgi:hypothetical protein